MNCMFGWTGSSAIITFMVGWPYKYWTKPQALLCSSCKDMFFELMFRCAPFSKLFVPIKMFPPDNVGWKFPISRIWQTFPDGLDTFCRYLTCNYLEGARPQVQLNVSWVCFHTTDLVVHCRLHQHHSVLHCPLRYGEWVMSDGWASCG